MLKSILVLTGIAVAAALLAPDYLLRFVDRNGRDEQAAVAVSSEPARPTATDHGGHVRLSADRRGHFVTGIEINDRPLEAMVDTGATVVALRYEDARQLNLVSSSDRFEVEVRTANGVGRAHRVELRSVRLGPITIRNVEALVMEQGALGANLLGMSFLQRLSRFEIQRGTLVLER